LGKAGAVVKAAVEAINDARKNETNFISNYGAIEFLWAIGIGYRFNANREGTTLEAKNKN